LIGNIKIGLIIILYIKFIDLADFIQYTYEFMVVEENKIRLLSRTLRILTLKVFNCAAQQTQNSSEDLVHTPTAKCKQYVTIRVITFVTHINVSENTIDTRPNNNYCWNSKQVLPYPHLLSIRQAI